MVKEKSDDIEVENEKDQEIISEIDKLNQDSNSELPEEKSSKKKKSKKKLILVLLILLMLGGIGAGWYFYSNSKSNPVASNGNVAKKEIVDTQSYKPENVVYAFRTTNQEPISIFYRPATGGDRKEVLKLDRDFIVAHKDAVKQSVVFGNENKIYASTDSGKSFKVIYQTEAGGVVNSIKLSNEGDRVALGLIPNYGENTKGKAFSIDIKGNDKKDLLEADKSAIYIIGWNNTKQQIAYSEGCYGCDGQRTAFSLKNLKTNKAEPLIPDVDIKSLEYGLKISDDFTKLAYVQSTYDASIPVDGIPGYYSAAPYTLKLLNLKDKKTSDLTTVGTKQEKNSNGTDKYRLYSVGFLNGKNIPYFAEGNEILSGEEKANNIFTPPNPFINVYYANSDTVISAYGTESNDFKLSHYQLSNRKSTEILSGDDLTTIIGVTTK